MRTHGNVLAHGLRGKGLHDLEGACQAQQGIAIGGLTGDVLTGKKHLAGVGADKAGHQGKQRGLAGPVGADQRGQAAGRHR